MNLTSFQLNVASIVTEEVMFQDFHEDAQVYQFEVEENADYFD